jgi:DNA end-binding protein Ku
MAPRANWKGSLRLSLVTCPVALYPATSEADKVSFNQINKNTGHRIKYMKVDADTGEEVASEDIVKGYKVGTNTYVEVTNEELDNLALESTRTIEIDEFVHRDEIDPRYIIRPYYLCPDGKVGHDAFAVIRETIRDMNMVAIGRVVLTSREHIIALEPLGKGLVGTLFTRCIAGCQRFFSRERLASALRWIVLQNSKIPPQQNSRESEFIASLD